MGLLLLRYEIATNTLVVLGDNIKRPRGVARNAAGICVTSDGLRQPNDDDGGDEDDDDDGEDDEGEGDHDKHRTPLRGTVLRLRPTGGFDTVALGFQRPAALVVGPDNTIALVAARYRRDASCLHATLFQIAPSGVVSALFNESLIRPFGLARDAQGGLFASGRRRRGGGDPGVVIRWVGDS